MSYASMTTITPSFGIGTPRLPAFSLYARRRALRRVATVLALAANSLLMAGALWLLLAGPGFLSDLPGNLGPIRMTTSQ